MEVHHLSKAATLLKAAHMASSTVALLPPALTISLATSAS